MRAMLTIIFSALLLCMGGCSGEPAPPTPPKQDPGGAQAPNTGSQKKEKPKNPFSWERDPRVPPPAP
jgi:hypothetical protein